MPSPPIDRFVETNGIRMHIVEQGSGPLVLLCHGFFGCWYTWNKQLAALAGAGYHAVAMDQRGFGQTDCPLSIDAYNICDLLSDIAGLVYALGETKCSIVGHDWGSAVAWNMALLRPDIIDAVCLLSVPYLFDFYDGPVPTAAMTQAAGNDLQIYQMYFQEPGRADAELNKDIRASLLGYFYSASATPPAGERWSFIFPKTMTFLDTIPAPPALPPWLTAEDLDAFVKEYQHAGFTGSLNWYRNLDKDRELLGFLKQAKIQQPSLYLAGEADAMITMYQPQFQSMDAWMPALKAKIILPDVGHWAPQEQPRATNEYLIDFLNAVA
jgi:pimeloyl-ACP methyl ester carboxylesterase